MGMFQRMARRSERRVIGQFIAETRQYAPQIELEEVLLPCHIIAEWHHAAALTIHGNGSAGIYRCQGHFWSVPLRQDQLVSFSIDADELTRLTSGLHLTPEREDLGLISNGGTLSLVGALATHPEMLAVRPTQSSDEEGEETVQRGTLTPPIAVQEPRQADALIIPPDELVRSGSTPQTGPFEMTDDEKRAEEEFWADFAAFYAERFPASHEGQLTAAFGATPENMHMKPWRSEFVFDADEHGIELHSGAPLHIYLNADIGQSPAMWVIALRADGPLNEDREYEPARDVLIKVPITLVDWRPPVEVAQLVKATLTRLADAQDDDTRRLAFLGALCTWCGIVLDVEGAIETIKLVESMNGQTELPNEHAIVERLQEHAELNDDQWEFIHQYDTDRI